MAALVNTRVKVLLNWPQDFVAHTCRLYEVPLYIHCTCINDHILQVRVQVTVLQINKQDTGVS